jgi:hypothetical protein
MANAANTANVIGGLLKNVFGELERALPPPFAIMHDRIGLKSSDMIGADFRIGVVLQSSHSITYAPTTAEAGSVTLVDALPAQVKTAIVPSFNQTSRTQISYPMAAAAASKGAKAFEQSYGFLVADLRESALKRLEHSILHGQRGICKISGNSSGVLTVSTDTLSGVLAGLSGALLEAFDATTVTANQHNGDLKVSAVSIQPGGTSTVTVTGSSGSVVANDYLYFKSARTTTGWNEGPGLFKQISTTTGTMFTNMDYSQDTFQSQQYNVNGQFSFSAIISGAMQAANYMSAAEDVIMVCAPPVWAQLANNESALRRLDSSYSSKRSERGSQSLRFWSGLSSIEVVPHPFCRNSEAGLFPLEHLMLVGASKLTSGLPGVPGELGLHVPDTNVYEIRMYGDMAPFIKKPSACVYYYGITL